jgi:hypothetical protein
MKRHARLQRLAWRHETARPGVRPGEHYLQNLACLNDSSSAADEQIARVLRSGRIQPWLETQTNPVNPVY